MRRFSLPLNPYAGCHLDRLALRRGDDRWVAEVLEGPRARLVLVVGSEMLADPRDGSVLWPTAAVSAAARREPTLLGSDDTWTYFAVDASDALREPELGSAERIHIKRDALRVPAATASVLAYARAMVHRHSRHRHRGVCGAATRVENAGHLRRCSREECGVTQFPRTDVAVIVLVTMGDSCFFARQAEWPAGHFATIAGFLEPGESLEDSVAREVAEESGLQVESLAYHSSQPWPFPGSIMVGYHARVADTRIDLTAPELDEGRWFTRGQLARAVESGAITLPPRVSISYRLIQTWYGSGVAGGALSPGRPQSW